MEPNDPPHVKEGIDPPQEQPATKIESSEPKVPPQKIKLNFKLLAGSIRSWSLNIIIIFLLFVLLKIVLQEIYDRGYHIQTLRVPQECEINGYDGVTTAYLILDDVNKMISIGNRDRSTKDVDDYKQSAGRTQLQVEVGGVGISPEAISSYIKQAMGIKSRSIDGEIVRQGNVLKLFLRISGRPTETLTQEIDSTGATVAFEKVIQQGAEVVLRSNYPSILASYYLATRDEKAMETFRYTIQQQPDQAATAYASMALCIDLSTDRDTARMMQLIRKSLSIDPNNSSAYIMWGIIEDQNGNPSKGVNLLRKASQLDHSNINTWATIGLKFLLLGENDEEAISCFKKCYSLDSTYTITLDYWARLLFNQGKFEEAKEKLDKLRFLDPTLGKLLLIAIPVAQGDSVLAVRNLNKTSLSTDELIGGFNTLADYQKDRKHYDLGIGLLRFALRLDSTSNSATYPYATLAEIYGLKGDKEKFYYNLEKSVRLGFKPDRNFNQIEPYKTFLSEERYKKVLAKYKVDTGSN